MALLVLAPAPAQAQTATQIIDASGDGVARLSPIPAASPSIKTATRT